MLSVMTKSETPLYAALVSFPDVLCFVLMMGQWFHSFHPIQAQVESPKHSWHQPPPYPPLSPETP